MSDTLHFEVEPDAKEARDIAKQEPSIHEMLAAVANQPDAVDRVGVIERLMALKEHEEDRQAERAFQDAFAKMQAELPSIKKTKEVKTYGGKHMYDYAPLDEIQRICNPILKNHGFSYSWREEAIEGGKRIYFDLFGYGHTKSNFFDAPLLAAQLSKEGNEVTNAVQAARKTSSYAKRNSMVDGLGLIIEDEDNDGRVEIDEAVAAIFSKIENATTDEALMSIYKVASEQYRDKENTKMLIYGKCQDRRRQLREGK